MKKLDTNTLQALVEKGLLTKRDFEALMAKETTADTLIGDGLLAKWYEEFYNYLEKNYSKLTTVGYTSNLQKFLEDIYGDDWAELDKIQFVTRRQVADWFDEMACQGYSFASIRRYKNSLMKFFKYLDKTHRVSVPVIDSLEVPNIDEEGADGALIAIRDEEVRGIIGHADTLRDRALLYLMYESGMRRQEVLDLLKTDIDLQGLKVDIRDSEGDIDRIGYFSQVTSDLVKEYLAEWDEELVTINQKREERARQRSAEFTNELKKSEYLFQSTHGPQVSYSTLFKNLKAAAFRYYLAVAKSEGHPEAEASEIAEEKTALVNTEMLRNSRRAYLFAQGRSIQEVQLLMGDDNRWVCRRFLKVAQMLYPESFRTK